MVTATEVPGRPAFDLHAHEFLGLRAVMADTSLHQFQSAGVEHDPPALEVVAGGTLLDLLTRRQDINGARR
jgi:hypothetical protein